MFGGFGGFGGGWKVQKWMVEVDRPCNLGMFGLKSHSETMTKRTKQQHEFFFGDMVTVDVWKKSMAKYMHRSL